MLKVWNMVLVLLTFSLTIFGTFLTRSGVISSVHSFTQSGLGPFFIGFLLLVILVAGGLVVVPAAGAAHVGHDRVVLLARGGVPLQQPDPGRHRLHGLLGHGLPGDLGVGARREDHGRAAVLQPRQRAARDRAALPHGRRAGHRVAPRHAAQPVARLRVAGRRGARRRAARCSPAGMRARRRLAHVRRSASSRFGTVVQEFCARHARAPGDAAARAPPRALARLVGKNRRRYGGYIIHVGVVSIFVGIAASSMFRIEVQQTLKVGDEMQVGRYTLALRPHRHAGGRRTSRGSPPCCRSSSAASRSTRCVPRSASTRSRSSRRPRSRTARRCARTSTSCSGSYDPKTQLVTIQAYVNPLVVWIWLGGLILASARPSRCGRRRPSARCACWRPARRGSPRSDGRARSGAAALLAVARCAAAASRSEPTQQEVEESLTCQCGCGLTVHSCNHLNCPSGEPMKAEIADRLGRGRVDGPDPRRVHRALRREGAVVADLSRLQLARLGDAVRASSLIAAGGARRHHPASVRTTTVARASGGRRPRRAIRRCARAWRASSMISTGTRRAR